MLDKAIILCVLTFLTSCASIVNSHRKTVVVYTPEPAVIIFKNDSIPTADNRAAVSIERKNESARLQVVGKNFRRNITLEPHNSFMYWSNCLFNNCLGMLADKKNPKRYSYPQSIYIHPTDTGSFLKIQPANRKGELYFWTTFPAINIFHFRPEEEMIRNSLGGAGITLGIDYFYSSRQYLSVSLSAVSDVIVLSNSSQPSHGPEFITSYQFIVSNNHRFRRLSTGYGLVFAQNSWCVPFHYLIPVFQQPVSKIHAAYGGMVSCSYQATDLLHVGVSYRPLFHRSEVSRGLIYEHVLGVDFTWKMRKN